MRDDTRLIALARAFLVEEPPAPLAHRPRVSVRRSVNRSTGNWRGVPGRSRIDIEAELAHLERGGNTDFAAGALCALRWVLGKGGAPCNA